jgi:hypothetical protein
MLNFERSKLTSKLNELKFKTSNNALILSEEYTHRLHLLRTLDYIDKNNMIGLKGKIACEISHLEVLVTELLFENKFDGKSCAELAAMLSPMTCQFTYAGNKEVDQAMDFKHPINLIVSFLGFVIVQLSIFSSVRKFSKWRSASIFHSKPAISPIHLLWTSCDLV